MTSTKPTIAALLALGVVVASGALAQAAASEPSGEPGTRSWGGAMMEGPGGRGGPMMEGPGVHGRMMRGDMRGMRGRDGPRFGRMGPGMLTMMMIMVDTNGDGALSLEEVQAVHARIFNYADTDGDGSLTLEELRGFLHGGGPGRPDRGSDRGSDGQ